MAKITIKDHGGRIRGEMTVVDGIFDEQHLAQLALRQVEKLIVQTNLDLLPNAALGGGQWIIIANGVMPVGTVEIIV